MINRHLQKRHLHRAILAGLLCVVAPAGSRGAASVIVVTGAPGEAEFEADFIKQAAGWREASQKAGARLIEIGSGKEVKDNTDVAALQTALSSESPEGQDPLWLVLNGHGTWDGAVAHFNLRGPDISDVDLAGWLKPVRRPVVIINTSSSSGPFIAKLSAPGRIVIAATKSGSEKNLTRYGTHFAAVLTDLTVDLDTDGAVSLLEAFLAAARRTAEFYKTEGRLATEHALIDDNGDGLGTPADWFKGLRAVKKSDKNAAADGGMARHFFLIPPASEKQWPEALAKEREKLEAQLLILREAKASMKEDDYFARVEPLLTELARLTQKAVPQGNSDGTGSR